MVGARTKSHCAVIILHEAHVRYTKSVVMKSHSGNYISGPACPAKQLLHEVIQNQGQIVNL
jgi:hypothetical protein